MLIGEPPRTQYDLHFSLAGFPVRISPLFWLAAVILGGMGMQNAGFDGSQQSIWLLSWIVVMFFSILVHELGHAIAMRRFGQNARIVLYMFGGLAIPDSYGFSGGSYDHSNKTSSRIIISLAGPGAGFLLAGICIAILYACGGRIDLVKDFPFFWHQVVPQNTQFAWRVILHHMLYVNILWGLLNLMPIYPLDGGQVSRELFLASDHRSGIEKSLWLSVMSAGAIAVWGLYDWLVLKQGGMFTTLMFGSLAYSSYQALQQHKGFGGGPRW